MELLNNPQIHSTFASLGSMQGESYVANEDCMSILEEINSKLSMEDHTLRTYRRAIGFGQNVRKDIIPLLTNVKDSKTIDSAVRLLVNLTVPIECLLSVEAMSQTDVGRHTIYELNRLLLTSKEVFVDSKATKAVIDYMKSILETDHKLTSSQCDSVNNCLLLLRNILHIPEYSHHTQVQHTSMQNQILWNLFTQSIDKLLIHLMSCPQKSFWGVTLVQLIALMYKDQHVGTLQKLLNHWFEAGSHSESSEDNESNTSPPKQSSGDSSPTSTSEPTSDSSDNFCGNMTTSDSQEVDVRMTPLKRVKPKPNTTQLSTDSSQSLTSSDNTKSSIQDIVMKSPKPVSPSNKPQMWTQKSRCQNTSNSQNKQKRSGNKQHSSTNQSELSDCGYGTQASQGDFKVNKIQESISTSSNDDDSPKQKPAHQKPPSTNQKQRFNAAQKQRNASAANAPTVTQEKKDGRRKKLVKRSKCSIISMKGLIHHTPTDEDISNILKEFTVDFLLKGYGFLVQELHAKLLNDYQLSIDTSHFFWLVTYFLKFAAQLELDLEHISPVLSYDVVSYLTFEGIHLCEQLELTTRHNGTDLKPYLRRIHLVVTAIREFLQALEVYKKSSHLSSEDKEYIQNLQNQIGNTDNLRNLFVLLLRCYNPNLQSVKYLQDLVVTNHILLILLDNVSKTSDPNCNVKMVEHIKQFATMDIMHQYGILLEGFQNNGEFVNDCIFTMMHHIGGDVDQVAILFQPNILKTYSQIWDTEYEICDEWSDLIEYVIHKFINTQPKTQITLPPPVLSGAASINDIWAEEEMDTLYWYYVQSKKSQDVIGSILSQIREGGHKMKSRIAVIQQLLQQDIIVLVEFDNLMKYEDSQYEREVKSSGSYLSSVKEESRTDTSHHFGKSTNPQDDINILRDRLLKENKGKLIQWLQQVLLESCYVKLNLEHSKDDNTSKSIMEPIPYHCILKQQSIPLVPFNAEQNKILVYQPFVLLLHKLGFHLPSDANKLFVRIPEFWSAEKMFMVAEKLGPISKKNLKFDMNLIMKPKAAVEPVEVADNTSYHESSSASDSAFASKSSKSTSPTIRFRPEVTTKSQNWLQMVMQSKNLTSESSMIAPMINISLPETPTTNSKVLSLLQLSHPIESINESLEVSSKDIGSDSDTTTTMNKPDFDVIQEEHEPDVIVESYETISVASSLICMYVSDEEDKPE